MNEPTLVFFAKQDRNGKFHLSRNHALKTAILKDYSVEVRSCIKPISANQVCPDVKSAGCLTSNHP